ncbi:uncharacterized protein LOC103388517 isoform X2 [Cynoglossus semilaevis]|uniref:uncharacterized protein LOC103388517 isoform X2 n=1 Tax=Cynoglossus semilaevis TaxID=244447 RepID=UPI0004964F5E|nr:uncharacterized protein LOC103388517 isoform X2 [Cynoglossus semilaevis]
MKLLGLVDLTLLFILASYSNGEEWKIQVNSHIVVIPGANVTIPCTFTYPKYVIKQYRGKTRLYGNPQERNCSLKIDNVQNSDVFYVRVLVNRTFFNFINDKVHIDVTGVNSASTTSEPAYVTNPDYEMQPKLSAPVLFASIFAPLSVLVVIALVIGVLFYLKRKRSESLTREESGYYGNVSRATLDKNNSEAPCQRHENKRLSKIKSIDEPIYVNTENLKSYEDESTDLTQNVYANY